MLVKENTKKMELLRGPAIMEVRNFFTRMRINDQKLES